MPSKPNPKNYTFHVDIRTAEGKLHSVVWRGLTRTKARSMYAYTAQNQPSNVIGYGWAETNCYTNPYQGEQA